MRDALRLALTTLTVAPVRGPVRADRETAGGAMRLAPLVGLLLGLLAAAVLLAFHATAPSTPLLAGATAVATLALLTRGLHLDGLADTVDGLASYRPPDGAREVMKQPDLGPLGAAALVLALLVQVSALAACVEHGRGAASVVLAAVAGRLAVTCACTPATPAAAPTGLGALVAGTVPRTVAAGLVAATAVLAAGPAALDALLPGGAPGSTGAAVVDAVRPLLALGLGLLAARALRRHAVRRLGGVTGDVLGALVEVTTTVVLVVLALDLPEPVQDATGWVQPR